MAQIMSDKSPKKDIFHDEWPKAYPHGRKAFLKALREAPKAAIFDVDDEKRNVIIIKK